MQVTGAVTEVQEDYFHAPATVSLICYFHASWVQQMELELYSSFQISHSPLYKPTGGGL